MDPAQVDMTVAVAKRAQKERLISGRQWLQTRDPAGWACIERREKDRVGAAGECHGASFRRGACRQIVLTLWLTPLAYPARQAPARACLKATPPRRRPPLPPGPEPGCAHRRPPPENRRRPGRRT